MRPTAFRSPTASPTIYTLLNERDGGINGVKITYEECETGYATDRGVECYERLKGKGPPALPSSIPLSTGITFALTEKAPIDKIPLLTPPAMAARTPSTAGFQWNFPLIGTYWDAGGHPRPAYRQERRRLDKLKGKKIALSITTRPTARSRSRCLQERAKMHGFELTLLPVTHPGVEQKATWLQIRQNRPD